MTENRKHRSFNEDITAQKQKETRDKTILRMAMDGFYIVDTEGRIVETNDTYCSMIGYSSEELLKMSVKDVEVLDTQEVIERRIQHVIETGSARFETKHRRKDGRVIDIEASINYLLEKQPKFYCFMRDITERNKANEELKRLNEILIRQAASDPLTGISNRTKFNEVLEKEIARSKRFKLPLSLIMMDIDHFKEINDTYGHIAGDNVLREFASKVSKSIRKNDLFTRWGGEEFMILVTNVIRSGTVIFAEKLRLEIEAFDFSPVRRITCSFGVTEFEKNDTIDSFIKKVDIALYRAKSAGRNRVESG